MIQTLASCVTGLAARRLPEAGTSPDMDKRLADTPVTRSEYRFSLTRHFMYSSARRSVCFQVYASRLCLYRS